MLDSALKVTLYFFFQKYGHVMPREDEGEEAQFLFDFIDIKVK